MKKYLIAIMAALVCFALVSPIAFAKDKRFDGVTLRVFANSHEPMLRANKWSVDGVKEKYGINILMDEAPYGTQYEKATSAFVAGSGCSRRASAGPRPPTRRKRKASIRTRKSRACPESPSAAASPPRSSVKWTAASKPSNSGCPRSSPSTSD